MIINVLPMPRFCLDWEVICIHIPTRYQSIVKFATRLAILHGSDYKSCGISIHGVNVSHIRALNKQYRKKDKPTNVLSFSSDALGSDMDPSIYRQLGDVYICLQVIAREARELEVPFMHHLAHMVVHAILHLVGYDHEVLEDSKRMRATEVRLLAMMGIENPYNFS